MQRVQCELATERSRCMKISGSEEGGESVCIYFLSTLHFWHNKGKKEWWVLYLSVKEPFGCAALVAVDIVSVLRWVWWRGGGLVDGRSVDVVQLPRAMRDEIRICQVA